ncbi:MAG: ABC transporter substrate-binding protein [Tistlia sp.]|uniref:ABC transporter substrate-binding protein n=1 Tax=Tistlia sp. TaxID=3057121 RepID=UPI0034A4FFA4
MRIERSLAVALLGAAGLLLAAPAPARAADTVEASLILNWIAGGDHAPYYYAKQEGWYEAAGLDLDIEQGKGSQLAAQRVGIGSNELGLADMGVVLIAKGEGAEVVAIMNVYANTPQGFYWLKSSGIEGPKDFPGKKIGNPPGDAARAMFPAFAQAVGIEADSVQWINVQANAKLSALKAGSIDVTTSFYNIHHIFQAQLGDDMGFVSWAEVGVNPYGNSLIANAEFLEENPEAVRAFVEVTQKAFAHCVEEPEACVAALVAANTGLKQDNELQNWELVTELMSNEHSRTVGLGHFEEARMTDDYALVDQYFEIKNPFEVESAYTNEFIDTSIKMPD